LLQVRYLNAPTIVFPKYFPLDPSTEKLGNFGQRKSLKFGSRSIMHFYFCTILQHL